MIRRYVIFCVILLSNIIYSQVKQDLVQSPFNDQWYAYKGASHLETTKEGLLLQTFQNANNSFLIPVYSDFSKDYSFEIDIDQSEGLYYVLFNASSDGINHTKIMISSYEVSIEKWENDKPKKLFKKKPKGFNTKYNHTVKYGQKYGRFFVRIEQEGKVVLQADDIDIEYSKNAYTTGIKMYKLPEKNHKKLLVTRFLATYTPIDLVKESSGEFDYYGKKENLGSAINTRQDELNPIVSQDGKSLYFIRETGDKEEIFVSNIEKGGLSLAVTCQGLNSGQYNSLLNISPDNKTAYVKGFYTNGTLTDKGISMVKAVGTKWGMPKGIDIGNYTNKNEYTSNFITSDGAILLACIEKKGGQGRLDMYVSLRDAKGQYSDLVNLGPVLNTPGSESGPFLCADNQTLYFSSDGHEGFGENDIYVTKRLDDTWTNWSKPVNLGPKINTNDWEGYMSVPASGDYIYFVSYSQSIGGADIYRIAIEGEEAKPEPVILLSGLVLDDNTKSPLEASVVYKDLVSGDIIGQATSVASNGVYQIILPYKSVYSIYAETDGYYSYRDTIDMSSLSNYKEQKKDLYLQKMVVGEPIRLNNIFFESGKSTLLPESYDELNNLVSILESNPNIKIKLNGHTDSQGSDQDNLKLSLDRVTSVRNYLLSKGISETRIELEGFGESQPLNDNSTSEKMAENRRVEFVILSQ